MGDLDILVIHRRTAFEQAMATNPQGEIIRLKEQGDPIVANMITAHDAHHHAMETIAGIIDNRGLAATWRHDIRGLIPDHFDLVITVGGDGTVLHASHAIQSTPILAINSSPTTSTGYFTAGHVGDFQSLIDAVLSRTLQKTKLYRMAVMVNGEPINTRVLNDVLFSNECPASTTRYEISQNGVTESQTSSGVWISTAAGSTAAVRAAGGAPMALGLGHLQFVVREPCPQAGIHPTTLCGIVQPPKELTIRSKSNHAQLYIDGPHVLVPVQFGDIITFCGGADPIILYGNLAKNKT